MAYRELFYDGCNGMRLGEVVSNEEALRRAGGSRNADGLLDSPEGETYWVPLDDNFPLDPECEAEDHRPPTSAALSWDNSWRSESSGTRTNPWVRIESDTLTDEECRQLLLDNKNVLQEAFQGFVADDGSVVEACLSHLAKWPKDREFYVDGSVEWSCDFPAGKSI